MAGGKAIINRVRERGFTNIYFYINTNVLDPKILDCVIYPTLGGINIGTLRKLLDRSKTA
jgi:hypothetical protein